MASTNGDSWLPPLPHRLDSMKGPGQTNWLIKGRVLCGPHPGQISTSELVKQLTSILSEGVTTFVCLQAEMPSPLSSAHHPLVGHVSQRTHPSTQSVGLGVTARPYIDDAQIIVDHGRGRFSQRDPLSFIHLPIPEDGAAIVDDAQLVPFVLDLIAHLKAREILYIHCSDGNGRTGTVACALLGLLYDLSSSETLDLVQRFRNHRSGTQGHMPDSHEQKMQVHRLLSDDAIREAARSVRPKKSSDPEKALAVDVSAIIAKIRQALARRGTTSMIALQRAFKIMDDDNSKAISRSEFQKAMRDFGVGLTKAEVDTVFRFYDKDGSGDLSFHEFLRGVRGEMNERRKALVQQAFQKLDHNGNGRVELDDIARFYKARSHPDVLAGKRTEKEVLTEFLDTFDVGTRDSSVSLAEFEDYYADISASIDDDNYFQLMMWNAWPFAGKANRNARKQVGGPKSGAGSGQAAGVARYGANTGAGGAGAGAAATSRFSRAGKSVGLAIYGAESEAARLRRGKPAVDEPGAGGSRSPADLMRTLRAIMKRRGARGLAGLARSFRIMDDDGSGQLNRYEFGKAMNDVGLRASRAEIDGLFAQFDNDSSGEIHYEEFLEDVRGPMNERRVNLVRQAFAKMDRDRNGEIDVREVSNMYNAERHPSVLSGQKSPDDVYRTFLDTFDSGVKDGRVTWAEFLKYYRGVSVSIDDDEYFEVMMTNCWNLDSKPAARTAWAGEVGHQDARTSRTPSRGVSFDNGTPSRGATPSRGTPNSGVRGAAGSTVRHLRRGKKVVGGAQSKTYRSNVPWDLRDTAMGTASEVAELRASSLRSPEKAARVLAAAAVGRAVTGVDGGAGAGAGAGAGTGPASHIPRGVERVQQRLRDQLKRRGAKGIIGLGRAFRIFDDDGSRTLNRYEFGKALKDYGLALSNSEVNLLWSHYDQDNNGTISYEEFIRGVRGGLNERRRELVHQAFRKLDRNGNGVVEVDDIRLAYDASHHPDVVSGRRTEADVLRAFLDTFDAGEVDGRVTLQEFEQYYANISASIDDDNYFQLMMWNAWNLQDNGQRKVSRDPAPYATTASDAVPQQSTRGWISGDADFSHDDVSPEVSVRSVLARVKTTIARRGTGSIAGLSKAFKIFDDDRSGDLDLYEFSKAMRDYGVGLSEAELKALFAYFDHDRNGKINYMEFLRGVRGTMSAARRALVSQAFARIDTNQNGVLTYEDLKSHYNAKHHKDVLSGRITERQAVTAFLNTFDGLNRDGEVTAEEFEDYYANVSASVDDDAYFQLMMWNSWNLGESSVSRSRKKAWAGQF